MLTISSFRLRPIFLVVIPIFLFILITLLLRRTDESIEYQQIHSLSSQYQVENDDGNDISFSSLERYHSTLNSKHLPLGAGRDSKSTEISSVWPLNLPPKDFTFFPLFPSKGNEINPFTPFTFKNSNDIRKSFIQWNTQSTTKSLSDMNDYLWKQFQVSSLAMEDDLFQIWDKSIRRHVAIFYHEYVVRGGKEEQHLGVPNCNTILLSSENDLDFKYFQETTSSQLEGLTGSQGSLKFLKIPLKADASTFRNTEGHYILLSKTFDRNQISTFSRELYAMQTLTGNHKGIVHAICYEKGKHLRILYPYLGGGDLIPLDSDHISYDLPTKELTLNLDKSFISSAPGRTLLTPDLTFMPSFFRQLILAVYAVHQKDILHLDIKPENFVITSFKSTSKNKMKSNSEGLRMISNNQNHPFYEHQRPFILPANHENLIQHQLTLIDFGLSWQRLKAIEEEKCINTGTPVTMAPEQLLCNMPVGRGTDWWAVGASMWRTRVFWEPTISEKERTKLLNLKDSITGHSSYPMMPFFTKEFYNLIQIMMTPLEADRDHSKNYDGIAKLLKHPYIIDSSTAFSAASSISS